MFARYLIFKSKLQATDLGASMIEYALLVVLIAILGFVAVAHFGDEVSESYGTIANELAQSGS
jgi:Flp pilus assembly pilin Flp